MKISGRLKAVLTLLFIVSLSFMAVGSAFGGNRWMMERNAGELLLINQQVIDELAVVEENGVVEIRGCVVMHDGNPVLQLDEIREISVQKQDGKSTAFSNGRYKVFIREDQLDEVPVVKEP